jgi:uncharacterized protein
MQTDHINPKEDVRSEETDRFISSAKKGENRWWRYLFMTIAPFLASNTAGFIPYFIVWALYSYNGRMVYSGNGPDLTASGISLNVSFVLMLFPFLMALLTFILLMKPIHNRKVGTVINGGIPIRWGRLLTSALVWVVISSLYLYTSIKNHPSDYVINNTSGSLYVIVLLAILLIPFQAAFEEILFRGYLMQGFALLTKNRWMPILITSLFFGLMHSINPEMKAYGFWTMLPQYVLFGIVFAIPTMLDDGVEIGIGAHAANNIFLSVFLTTKSSALQTPALYMQVTSYPWKEFAGQAVNSVLFLVILFIIFRWKDLSKLYGRVEVAKKSPVV